MGRIGGDERGRDESVRGVVRRSGECCVGEGGALEGSEKSCMAVGRCSDADVRNGGRVADGGLGEREDASRAAEISS